MNRFVLAVLAGIFVTMSVAQPTGASEAQRIVSLNPCLDTILVAIARREQIAALSHYSLDPQRSIIVEIASTFPTTHETAEEVLLLQPGLVLATRHSALATRNALGRLGVRVITYDVPDSIEATLTQIRQVSQDIGRAAQGEALVRRMRATFAAAQERAATGPWITAAIYQSGGLTAGPATLPGELMHLVRLENVAEARYEIERWRPLPLERLIADPPQILLTAGGAGAAASRAERVVQHRALRAVDAQMMRADFPARLVDCGGPVVLEALATLESVRESWLHRAGSGGRQ